MCSSDLTVSKKCWTPQRHPPAMYTVSILLTFLLLLVQFASMLCTPYGFLASCKSIHHTNSQKVLPHHCRVIIILLKAISLIKWDRFIVTALRGHFMCVVPWRRPSALHCHLDHAVPFLFKQLVALCDPAQDRKSVV